MQYLFCLLILLVTSSSALAFTASDARKISQAKQKENEAAYQKTLAATPKQRAERLVKKKILPEVKQMAQVGGTSASFMFYKKEGCVDKACTDLLIQKVKELGFTVEPNTRFFTGEEAFGSNKSEDDLFQLIINWDKAS
jgi:hypothetical protein